MKRRYTKPVQVRLSKTEWVVIRDRMVKEPKVYRTVSDVIRAAVAALGIEVEK